MARRIRSAQLETRTQRLKLAPRWKPYSVSAGPGVRLAYRRKATTGRWSVIAADGKGGNWLKAFADADDFEDANGNTILNFGQALDRARLLARGDVGNAGGDGKPITLSAALNRYETDLKARGGRVANVARVRRHLPDGLRHKPVMLLTADELWQWRNVLGKTLANGSINRVANALRAALNLAADSDPRLAAARQAWKVGLKAIPDAVETRNVILSAETIHRIVTAAYAISGEFGLLVETAATTGARVSQLAGLEVQDVQHDRTHLRLMMPSSKKGKGKKKIIRRPVPIPESLALRLRQIGRHKAKHSPLLVKPSGEGWKPSDHTRPFRQAVAKVGLDPAEVTITALRHSNIVRQLLANVPIRVVAVNHDTSVPMIEKTYSKNIADHSDALARPALLDLSAPAVGNVVPLGRKS
jgi:integrase